MPGSVIITIVVVLGVIVAGGFLMYFCGDLLMGLAGKKKDADIIKEKQLKDKKEVEDRVNALSNSDAARQDPAIAALLYDGAIVEAYNPDEEETSEIVEDVVEENAEEAQEEVEENSEVSTEEVAEEVQTEEEQAEDATEAEEEDETAAFIRQRRAELMARLAKMQAEQEAEEEEAEEEGEEEGSVDLEETTEDGQVEEAQEEVETEETAESEEIAETVEATEDEESEEESKEVIIKDAPKGVVLGGTLANLNMEELEARLADEQERLKENEKDLRQCKKEYIPLKRVKTTLERDENKLRRKEALVAKQKVVLYGVNNYSDIDEEKAKKLAEDLDLLDGLKLSVQHCQEVMDKNEDRYPLLEKIYTLLTAQNEEIKADIQEIQEAIARLQNPTDTDAE